MIVLDKSTGAYFSSSTIFFRKWGGMYPVFFTGCAWCAESDALGGNDAMEDIRHFSSLGATNIFILRAWVGGKCITAKNGHQFFWSVCHYVLDQVNLLAA